MRSTAGLATVTAAALALLACDVKDGDATRDPPRPSPASRVDGDGTWVLVVDEEFDGDAIDAARWFTRSGPLVHPKTLNSASREMLQVERGSLFVRAAPTPNAQQPYTAGYLDSQGRFAQTYGKVEFRMRGQFAPGLWYAIWARPWENPVPEIDVELLAENINQVWFVNHWALPPIPADDRRSYTTFGGIDVRDFHTYAIVWTPEAVEWRVDGETRERVTGRGVPHEPLIWIMNVWVGGWGGMPRPETVFPAGFEVDYFRVYRHGAWLTDPKIRVRAPRPSYSVGDTVDVEIADFDRGAFVEVREGARLVDTLVKPPYRLSARRVGKGRHALSFVATDGARRATTSLELDVH